jgi:Ser/Thr protein kinase RdoA (MazF antagonist)
MDDEDLTVALPRVLDRWGLSGATVTALGGGMNSATARVAHRSGARVAKWVPSRDADGLVAGCETAALVEAAGIPAGAAVPALDGSLVVALAGGSVALLDEVPGLELTGETPEEQSWMGSVLAAAHRATDLGERRATFHDDWLETPADAPAWLGAALASVREEYAALPPFRWSRLHGDPAPEAFLHDPGSGRTGLIDWAGTTPGPVLYDVASAVMYLGGPDSARPFLAAYGADLAHLDTFRRLRWCVQATYFSDRLARKDLTGIADRTGNEKGLDDARRGLEGLS